MSSAGRDEGIGGGEALAALANTLSVVRSGNARTRQEVRLATGLGRTAVTNRLNELLRLQVIEEDGYGPSIGGRSPRTLRFRSEAGRIVAIDVGASGIATAVSDLGGALLGNDELDWSVANGPTPSLEAAADSVDGLLKRTGTAPVWGVGVGLPGPVEFRTGRPTAPPIMPGWDGFDVRGWLGDRFEAPVWVDNDVNLMALGEFTSGAARGIKNLLFVKVGTGIGAGLVSNGALHRGDQGCAGDIGHMAVAHDSTTPCRCGKLGCLEAHAGGAAIANQGVEAGASGRSPFLQTAAADGVQIDARLVAKGADHGDTACTGLIVDAGDEVGRALAALVSAFNPSMLVLGGGVTNAGESFMAAVRQAVYSRSLPLATRDLQIVRSELGSTAGVVGAVALVVEELFSSTALQLWIDRGGTAGFTDLPRLINDAG